MGVECMTKNRLGPAVVLLVGVWLVACDRSGTATEAAGAGSSNVPDLVRPDGSYPTVSLEKDTVVVKVIQSGVQNLEDFDDVQADRDRASRQGQSPSCRRICLRATSNAASGATKISGCTPLPSQLLPVLGLSGRDSGT